MTDKVLQLEYRWMKPSGTEFVATSAAYTSVHPYSAGGTMKVGAGGDVEHNPRAGSYFLVKGLPADFDFKTEWNWYCCPEIRPGGWWTFRGIRPDGTGAARLYV